MEPDTPAFAYDADVLAGRGHRRPPAAEVVGVPGLVVEDRASAFTGAIVRYEYGAVVLEDGVGRERLFQLTAGSFAIDGRSVTLVRPTVAPSERSTMTASGSTAAPPAPARVARASRIVVEGKHDAELVEKVWGDDLRHEGIVVEALDGIDDLAAVVRAFAPSPERRLGVLVDHLVPGSKESRIVAEVHDRNVLVTGHPYVDIWEGVRPNVVGIAAWPNIEHGTDWKTGICAAVGVAHPAEMWRRILTSVRSYADLERPLIGAVEELIDFVTAPGTT